MNNENASTSYSHANDAAYSQYQVCGYCQYRLPCGYCKELQRTCPYTSTTTITYSGSTLNNVTVDNNAAHIINKAENVII